MNRFCTIAQKCILVFLLALSASYGKAQTTLVAGDIAITGYQGFGASATADEFSFVLLRNITANTVINFTDNGWLSTNVFRTGETTVTWTAATALNAGTEVKIVGTTATLAGAGNPGTVTGTALSLSANGDQVLAYQGTAASPTFITGIHMNVYSLTNPGDPVTTTAAAWDGTANTVNSSALPTGLTNGTNAIWIGTQGDISSEKDNARFICAGDLSTVASIKTLIFDQTKWTTSDGDPSGLILPTGCSYITAVAAPTINTQPANSTICAGANASFSITATGAVTFQWQVDNGGGFANITNDVIYSGATTTTLNITAAPLSFNGYQYRCVATNGTGFTNSNAGVLTVTALPAGPTLLAKTPATATVADGTPVSATFNAGSGGTGCSDDFRYTTNGGASYLPYTPGSNISTTGLAAGSGAVTIEGRRANCSAGCQGNYVALASWIVTPLPGAATTLNAGDIAFSSYAAVTDEFSFVLLRNIGPGTVINFTNNGWLVTSVFRTGEETATWTSNAAYGAGTEIKISGLTATLQSGGSAGTVTGTGITLNINGDQVLAYRGSAAAPTFIAAIHMNVFSTAVGDLTTTTAAAWDGAANSINGSSLPPGLTTGLNAIWIGTQGVPASEFDNSRYGNCAGPGTLGPIATLRAALNNQANWISNNNPTPGFAIPTGCNYMGIGTPPNITGQPANANICAGANTSFTVTATGASTYQWQVNTGSGFNNITDDAVYSGATTATLNLTAVPIGFNGYLYQCVVTNGSGSSTSNSATLTVTVLPTGPSLASKTPAAVSVADGTPVSATFAAGSGGTGCADDFRYTIDGGATYLPYTPGANISTTGLAAGSGWVFVEGRRANCSAGCQGTYTVLAAWYVTPLPAAPTTLNAGDIGFTGYTSTTVSSDFSFVLLRNVGAGTTINFTDNGWLSTNVLRTGENTVTWTAPAGGLTAGTEITIAGLTATKAGGGAAGTVTGTALALSQIGDQILAYRGTAAAPTFISAIHMNVYSTTNGDPVTTTAAAWDGTANTISASALPTGLTTGVNALWIGTQGVVTSEFMNARYGNCGAPGIAGPFAGLRAALNNQANWTRNNSTPPGFVLPVNCNFFGLQAPSITSAATLTAFTSCTGTASAEQNFTVSGNNLTTGIVITAPTGFEVSTTSGSGFVPTLTLPPASGAVATTTIFVRMAASATGTPSGNITLATTGVTTVNIAVTGTASAAPTTANAGIDSTLCALTINLYGNTPTVGAGAWTQVSGPGTTTFSDSTQANSTATVTFQGTYTYRWAITNPGCPASADTVAINFRATPPVANAGPDRNLCLPSSNLSMAANVPTPGIGTWTQVNGPVTANFSNPFNPAASVSGLNTVGVYTFVWTITNAPCPATTDTMTITVSNPPPFFDVVGAFACQGAPVTLTGASNPNFTYTWARSLSGISGTFFTFGGTGQTQPITVSGSYQLTTTNQFGCTMTDTAIVHIADYQFTGSLAAGDAQLTNRINRFGQVSTCAAPKGCPGVFSGTGARLFDSYTIINKRNAPVCATVGLASGCGTNIFNVAYLRSFDPANPCTNYLGDPGSSFPASGFMEVTIPALDTLLIVVHEVSGGTGCSNYILTVDVPRDPAAIAVSPTPPICSGAPVTITGAVADTYSWTPGGTTTQAITVTPSATTQFNVTYGYGNIGCTKLDSVNVVIGNTVTTAFAGNDTATCGTTITLAANTPVTGTGAWTQASGPGTITFGAAGSPNSTATASVNGTYKLYWTITAGAPCPGTSIDSVLVNFDAQPTANAGPDLTVCASPGSRTLSGVAPSIGSGSWQFIGGPATASIFPPPTNPNAGVVGMTVPGTYTFVWTVTNGACPFARDTMIVVSNPAPAVPTITGGGVTVCQGSTVTLSGPVDPNFTYNWERALGSNGAPFSSVGTSQTLATTVSGVYRLTVFNQFGCAATSNQTIVHVADYVFNGSIGAGDPQQTGRINRFGTVSTCAAPKACPGVFSPTGARAFDSYQIINRQPVPVCATIGTNNPCGTNILTVAYLKSFDPSNTCTNYLGDPGSSFATGGFFEVTIPANDTIIVVVHEVNSAQGCANYELTVNVPRDLSAIVINPPTVSCASTATLTAPVANTYLWSPGGVTTRSITTPPLFVNTQFNVTLGYGNNGCTRADSATVVVTSAPPTVTCPANISLTNTTGLCGRAVTYTTTVGGTPTPTLTYAFTGATTGTGSGNGSGSTFNVGTTTVTVTATNACGSVNCSFTVTITDNQPPTVTTGTISSCYPTVAAAQAAALAATSATDNCPGTLTETASTVGTCSAVITVRTTDVAGNFTDVTYNTRIDNTAPTVTVGTISGCYPTVAAAQAAALAATSATDNCPGALVETASTVGTCSAVITVTTTDGCGNATAVTYNTRIDNTAPTVTTGTIGSCYPTVAAAEAAALAATSATDNCPGALIETASTVGTCSAVITVTTQDGCGNATAVTYNTRIDNTAPTVTVGTISSCYPTVAAAEAAALAATSATDNCPGALTETAATVGTCSAVITVTTTDGCGNATAVTYNTRIDNTAPTVTVGTIGSCYPTAAAAEAAALAATSATDNCPGALTEVASTVGTCSAAITVTTTDGCGNATAVTYNTRIDNTAPTVTVGTIGSCYPTAAAAEAAALAATSATDNCPGALTEVASTVGTCSAVITVTTTDGCGNATAVTYNTRIDNTAPTVTVGTISSCYPTVAAAEAAALAATSATDNCPGALTEVASTVGTCSAVITVTTTDGCGNATVVTYNTRIDNTPPTLTCPAPVTVSCVSAVPPVNINTVTGVTDNCPGTIVVTHQGDAISSQTCTNRYTITRTYRATDGCGNFTECTQIITVNDQTPPTISCPAPITVCGAGAVPPADITSVSGIFDNCGGVVTITHQGDVANSPSATAPYTITRTYRATDVCGNFAECTQTITVNPIPTVDVVANQIVCNGANTAVINFTSPVSGTIYDWTNSNTAIGLAATGNGNFIGSFVATNNTNAPITATITVTPTANNCPGPVRTFTITVNPTPTANTVANQTLCNGSPTTAVTFSGPVSGTTYSWTNSTPSIGLAASGNGNIASFTATNSTNAPVTATISVTPTANGCPGPVLTFTITVNPTPTVNVVANQTLCNGSPTTAVSFSSPVSGTTYSWTNNTTSIGLAASGNGNIASFTATNTTNAPVTATISVTPTANGCPGPVRTFTITVNPTPTTNTVANQTLCNGSPTTAVNFSGPVAGTTYSWTNNTTSIGLAASGNGNIASFTATNTTNAPVTATITVTPTANGCPGPVTTFTITVNPTPTVNAVLNQSLCNGIQTVPINFSGPVAGTTYSWTNSTPSIGLPASGTGNIAGFNATNTGATPVVATITVTPTANGCPGPVSTFTITVNPTPVVTLAPLAAICGNAPAFTLTGGSPAGAGGIYFVNGVPQTSFNPANYTPGVHTVLYQFTNQFGCANTAVQNITVHPVPVSNFTINNSGQCLQNNLFVFTNTSTGAVSYSWNFGDATTSTAVSPTKSYAAAGTYTVTLTATSVNGCVQTFSRTVTVYPQPAKPSVVPELGNGIRSSIVENSYSWYLNGNLITGGNAQGLYFYPQTAGFYQVQVTTSFGCSTRSDSLYYIPEKNLTAGADRQLAFVYPIPAKDDVINVHFNLPTRNRVDFTLYTIKGQILLTGVIPVGTRTYRIDVRRYPSATYVLRMSDVDGLIRGILVPMMR